MLIGFIVEDNVSNFWHIYTAANVHVIASINLLQYQKHMVNIIVFQ